MKLIRAINKVGNFLKKIKRLSFRSLYHMISKSTDPLPLIAVNSSKHGTFCGLENDYIYKCALEAGINEPHFKEIINHLIPKDANILDVGANIGAHSVFLSKHAPDGQIFSFEPQSLVFSILQNNLLLNNCTNVTPYRFAVTNKDNDVISMEPFSFSKKKINNGVLSLDNSGISAGDLTLTRQLDNLNLPHIDFIKFDIQGSEINALKGAHKIISENRPILFIEIEEQHLKKFGGNSKTLIEKILSYDYIMYRIETDYPCDHLCIPKEKNAAYEHDLQNKISFPLSKIDGKNVELTFKTNRSQNYETIKVT